MINVHMFIYILLLKSDTVSRAKPRPMFNLNFDSGLGSACKCSRPGEISSPFLRALQSAATDVCNFFFLGRSISFKH